MKYKFKLLPSLFTLFFVLVFVKLGFWQIYRYHYKQNLMTQFNVTRVAPPIKLKQALTKTNPDFQHVKLTGTYLNNKTILLDNKFNNNKVGFEVLTPLQLTNGRSILINRGWIPANQRQQLMQKIPPINGRQTLTGYIKTPERFHFILGNNILAKKSGHNLLQKFKQQDIQKLTGLNTYPFVIRLDSNQANGFLRNWQPLNSDPKRSKGYAVQWFLMAAALIAMFLYYSRKQYRK